MVMDVVSEPTRDLSVPTLFVDVSYTEYDPKSYSGIVLSGACGDKGDVTKFGRNPELSLQDAVEENYRQLMDYHRDHVCDKQLAFLSSWDNFRMDSDIDFAFFDDDMVRRRNQNS